MKLLKRPVTTVQPCLNCRSSRQVRAGSGVWVTCPACAGPPAVWRPRLRTVVVAAAAAAFLALFLYVAGSVLPWFPLLLAVDGLAVIVVVLLVGIRLQERSDDRAAAANLARIRRIEADERQHALWKARLG